jgi:hypothetical protein
LIPYSVRTDFLDPARQFRNDRKMTARVSEQHVMGPKRQFADSNHRKKDGGEELKGNRNATEWAGENNK